MKKKTVKEFMSKYDGSLYTIESLAKALGCSVKTVRNRKSFWIEQGINFETKYEQIRREREEVKKLSSWDKTLTLKNNPEVLKVLANHLADTKNLPYPFKVSEEFEIGKGSYISAKKIQELLDKSVASLSCPLSFSDLESMMIFLSSLASTNRVTIPEEEKLLIEETFKDETGFNPTEEQIRTISLVLQETLSLKQRSVRVQSVAGASKTTCMKVVQRLIKEKGEKDLLVVSSTWKALTPYENSSTVASLFQKASASPVVNTPQDRINTFIRYRVDRGLTERIPQMIVDEYTLLTPEQLEALHLLCDKIVYVGDSEQLSNCNLMHLPVLSTLTEQYRFLESETDFQVELTKRLNRKDYKGVDQLLAENCIGTFKGNLVGSHGEGKRVQLKTRYSNEFRHLKNVLSSYTSPDSIIVAYSTAAVEEINYLLNGGAEIKEGSKIVIDKSKCNLVELKAHDASYTVLRVTDDVYQCVDNTTNLPVNLKKEFCKLGYAVTSTVAQGSSWDNVLAVIGTSNKANFYKDAYSSVTRARKNVKVILRTEVIDHITPIMESLATEEGNRNNALYTATKHLAKYMTDVKGLPLEEAEKTQRSAQKLNVKTKEEAPQNFTERSSSGIPRAECERSSSTPSELQLKGSNRYGLIIDSVHPTTEQTSMTEKQASYRADQLRKNNKEVTVVENLKNGNRVVIDLDSKEAVEAFKDQLEQTEAYIGDGTVHLVYTVDKEYKTLHSTANSKIKGDFLGNSTHQLRKIKPNKVYNNKEAVPLPSEVYERFLSLIK